MCILYVICNIYIYNTLNENTIWALNKDSYESLHGLDRLW